MFKLHNTHYNLVFVLLSVLLLIACTLYDRYDRKLPSHEVTTETPTTFTVSMPNVATEHCEKKDGIIKIIQTKEGFEQRNCHLPDGQVIEEWELYQYDRRDIGHDFKTKITCEEAGHTWLEKAGRSQQPLCTKTFTDGGKQCTSSNQCEGDCLNFKSHLTPAKEGVCQYYDTTFGCFNTIEASQKNEPMMCID